MNAILYQCLFNDIHHIPYVVNNVMLFLDYMNYIWNFTILYKYVLVLVSLVAAFCCCHYLLACCLAVIKLKFKL